MGWGLKVIYSETNRGLKEKIMLGREKTTKNIRVLECVLPRASRSNCAMKKKSRAMTGETQEVRS